MVPDDLLATVLRAPHDDTPRLVCADWLAEHGDTARAELIRVQCTLAAGTAAPGERSALEQRERELLEHHGWDWAARLGGDAREWVFRRGFVERVGLLLEQPSDDILRILRKEPIVHVRDYSQMCDLSGLLGALPQLSHLTGLELWTLYACDDALVRELLRSPHLRGLRTLILHHDRNGNLVDDEVLVEGLHSPHRAGLEELAVNVDGAWRGPSEAVLAAIATSPHLRNLRKLHLSNAGDSGERTQLTVESARSLFSSPNLARIEELDLRAVRAAPEVWQAILEALPRSLRKLYLADASPLDAQGYVVDGGPQWREAFEARVACVDWETCFIDPWNGGVWRGQSWEGRRERMLLAIQDGIRSGDLAALEAGYRDLCGAWSDPGDTERIEQLALDGWLRRLERRLREGAEAVARQGRGSLVLRIQPHARWAAALDVYGEGGPGVPGEPLRDFAAYMEGGYSPSETTLGVPPLAEADAVLSRCRTADAIRPHGPWLYLVARVVAAIGRCVDEAGIACPVYVGCRAMFRLR